ncbi:uncharacterized protein LOC114795987 isoform X2 [Denticeps clupeoides]|uniref:uncharacterized protein LOC114795987 isoform X1 n=1 Tax=Denticeps clupeoides TaxID=299321 RepID=UPI0010A2FB14|nr:uncharacterized protein LOC114795987 isoform X1 [Denticeps clupeoides]XP_028845604.1 uncharacterized protein LOC114795987 isoform X2 [Denticeps clupeoides]
MEQRTNRRGVTEHFVKSQHVNLQTLRKIHKNDYLCKDRENENCLRLSSENNIVPRYPAPVEFHVSKVAHVTTQTNMDGILSSSGFKGKEGLVWWGLRIGQEEINAAQERYLETLFPNRSPEQREAQQPFLQQFTTSPAFLDSSRYGNFCFSFQLDELMKTYQEQICGGQEPRLRVHKTVVYRQEIMYSVVVHSPEVEDFNEYQELHDNDAVCSYREGKIIWRAQAMSGTHRFRLIQNHDEQHVEAEPACPPEYYMWDNICLVFHIPEDKTFTFSPPEMLVNNLTACHIGSEPLSPSIPYDEAQKIVESKKLHKVSN